MPQRNFSNKHEQQSQPVTNLRRSPRILQNIQTDPENPKNPNLKLRNNRPSSPQSSPFSSPPKFSQKKTQKHSSDPLSSKTELNVGSNCYAKSSSQCRRSTRLNKEAEGSCFLRRSPRVSGQVNVKCESGKKSGKSKKGVVLGLVESGVSIDSQKLILGDNLVKNVSRRANRRNADNNSRKIDGSKCNLLIGSSSTALLSQGVSDVDGDERVVVLSKNFLGRLEKRVTRSSSRKNTSVNVDSGCSGFVEVASNVALDKGVKIGEEKPHVGATMGETFTGKSVERMRCSSTASLADLLGGNEVQNIGEEGGEKKERNTSKDSKTIGIKRKRNLVEEDDGVVQGWTTVQELALQRAYFAAKPTPHFWKKVARLVPGKSAQDCFDKIHSDHLTPLQPRTRSRAKKSSPSSLSLSASRLLNCSGPTIKKPSYRKTKRRLAHKTARKLLEKQGQVDRDYNADLFSVLEPTMNPSTQAFQQSMAVSTPEQAKSAFFKRCRERSSSAHKKQHSRFSILHGTTLVSPPVLKQVKNKALHEKYIDLLHGREARRKAQAIKNARSNQVKEDKKNNVEKIDAIKAAKNALVFDAMDAINQFQHSEANAMSNFDSADDYNVDSDDEEGDNSL